LIWFKIVENYNVETIDYWIVFWWILNKIEIESYIRIFWHSCCWVENPWWVRFNKVYFTNFKAKLWKILIFEWFFFVENSKQLQKLGLEGKTNWVFNVFTLSNLWFFKCEKFKNVFTLRPTTQVTILHMEVEPWPSNMGLKHEMLLWTS
jgi:hypothetical protein